jgi:hypothetical protein
MHVQAHVLGRKPRDRRETDLPIGTLLALDINWDRENRVGSLLGDVERNGQGYTLVGDVFNLDCDRTPVAMSGTRTSTLSGSWA